MSGGLPSSASSSAEPGSPTGGNRAVIVGAGVGGLACALRLANQGWQVQVFEQGDTVGGKLGVFERDGFRFDTGPSIVTIPSVLERLFVETGTSLERHLRLRRLDPIARYRFADGTWFDAAADDDQFFANAEQLRSGNAAELRRLFVRSEAIWNASRKPFLESPLNALEIVKLSRKLGDLRTIAPWQTMRALTKSYVSDPRMVTFVDRYATYTGSDPRKAPAALASVPYAERAFGGWYVEGGLREIALALASRCRDRGVEIHVGASVTAIRTGGASGARVSGVDVEGERIPADVVVANADARHLYGDLIGGDQRARRALRRLDRSQASLSGFVLCLAVRGETPNLAHHTVLFPTDYDAEFDALFGKSAQIVREPTIYASVPRDPAVAPPGHEAWFVLVNAPRHSADGNDGVNWDEPGRADSYADSILEQMAERGLDVRDRVLWRELRTPADLERRTRAVGGAIYGTSSNGPQAAFLRPANRSPIPGLFLVGGSSHPGGGLPLVTLSAEIAAHLIGSAPG